MSEEELAGVVSTESAAVEEESPEVVAEQGGEEETTQAVETTESGEKDPATAEESEGEPEKDKPKETDGVQRRMNKLTAEKYKLREELEEANRLRVAAESKLPQAKEPQLDDPDINYDQDKLVDAKVAYKIQQQKNGIPAAPQADPVLQEKVAAFGVKLAPFKEANPDYDNVISAMPIGQSVSDAILEMDNGPAVAYYLGTHLDALDEINNLSPVQVALKVSSLSRKLEPVTNKLTEAPEPVSSVATGGGKVTKNVDDMSVAELDAYDAQQFAANNG